jgi:hypothetical protein
VNLPLTLSLSGSGLNPDQILPDFASFQSGTAFFDGTLTPFEFTVDVDILGVAIGSLGAAPVPAVPLVARLLVGALILGAFSAFAVTGRIR